MGSGPQLAASRRLRPIAVRQLGREVPDLLLQLLDLGGTGRHPGLKGARLLLHCRPALAPWRLRLLLDPGVLTVRRSSPSIAPRISACRGSASTS